MYILFYFTSMSLINDKYKSIQIYTIYKHCNLKLSIIKSYKIQ